MQFPMFRLALAALFGLVLLQSGAFGQGPVTPEGPDSREIPVPAIKTSMGTLPGVKDLPARAELPDAMVMNDGTRVRTLAQWTRRSAEIRKILEYYAVGSMPPPPGNVTGQEVSSQPVLGGKARYRLVKLTFGPERKLELYIGIFTPTAGKGPFPTIISQSSEPPGGPTLPRSAAGPNQGKGEDVLLMVGVPAGTPAPARSPFAGRPALTAEQVAQSRLDVLSRGYALVVYNDNDCAEDTTLREADGSFTFRHTRFYPAYPGYDWGILGGWAWGASRVADYLVSDSTFDKNILLITGASRAGKSALIAAAFDDRLIGAPVVTGGGGIGAYRYAGADRSESLDMMEKKYPNWFSPHLHEFWGQRERLPFDEHWFLALCAPRPFLALEGDADTISLPDAVKHSIDAARLVYALYGEPGRLGVHYSHHAHAFTGEDWTAMMDFTDKELRNKPTQETFNRFPTPEERAAAVSAAAAKPRPAAPEAPPQ